MEFKRTPENSIWIRGNDEHPERVIALLEQRGGENHTHLPGRCGLLGYYIADGGVIACVPLDSDKGRLLQEIYGELHLDMPDCATCKSAPACDLDIPCCKCDNEDCNGRQPCPKHVRP